MSSSYDLKPTDALAGFHFVGTVARRFLVNYPVPPEVIQPLLPPGAEVSTWGGSAWVSACFVDILDMRPRGVPAVFGMRFNYLIHRTRALLPFPDGVSRESVLILQPNLNRRIVSWASGLTTGIPFQIREIGLVNSGGVWRLNMSHQGKTLLDVEIPGDTFQTNLPPGSLFRDADSADRFLLEVSHGGWWDERRGRLRLLAETHDPWQALVSKCTTHKNAFVESLCGHSVEADHVITMTDVLHCFAPSSVEVDLRKTAEVLTEPTGRSCGCVSERSNLSVPPEALTAC